MDPLIPFQSEVKHLFLSWLSTDIPKVEPMNLSMFFHEYLSALVVCTIGVRHLFLRGPGFNSWSA